MIQHLSNWGGYPKKSCEVLIPADYQEVISIIKDKKSLIARGAGKCYGDAALASVVIQTMNLNKVILFNEKEGIFHCQSGVYLSSILELIVPKGFFLPVSPGTKFITIGGAVASDIHGKNHHVDGVFSDHVLFIKLINEKGEITEAKPGDELFYQTVGGMGSTGIIVEICIRLKRIETAYIKHTAIRANDLAAVFDLFEKHKDAPYSVAWIDCLSSGKATGRSVLLLGSHATVNEVDRTDLLKLHNSPKFNVPFFIPAWVLNVFFVKCFNWLYYRKPGSSVQNKIVHYDTFFYPLDAIHNWNRIYGKRGFVQYQFVIPKEQSYETIRSVLNILAANRMSSFLAVLKLFGKSHNDRYLHFPMEGYTLALDIAVTEKIWSILDKLDEMITSAGGKVYLAKDARMKKEFYVRQYTRPVPENNVFKSYQMKRLTNEQKNVFLILGANSDIAKEAAIAFMSREKDPYLILASRDINALKSLVEQHHWQENAEVVFFNANDIESHKTFVKNLPIKPRWVLYACGKLIDNEVATSSTNEWIDALNVNFSGAVSVFNELLNSENGENIERIIGISSVAGLRGRKSNYMYGALKSGFHAYLFGLRQNLKSKGILVQAITPGFVRTKMTKHLTVPSNAVEASLVGKKIINDKTKNFEIYPNFYWSIVARLVKILPEFIIAKI